MLVQLPQMGCDRVAIDLELTAQLARFCTCLGRVGRVLKPRSYVGGDVSKVSRTGPKESFGSALSQSLRSAFKLSASLPHHKTDVIDPSLRLLWRPREGQGVPTLLIYR